MKWYDASKKKPVGQENVLICPSGGNPIGFYREGKWLKEERGYCRVIRNVQKWAYIDYPKASFEYLTCSRKWRTLVYKCYWKIWRVVVKKIKNLLNRCIYD